MKFLRQIDRETPKGKTLHLIADSYATHNHPVVQDWLARHPRFNMHFKPTSASWLTMAERFFRDILQKVIRINRRLSSKLNGTLHRQMHDGVLTKDRIFAMIVR